MPFCFELTPLPGVFLITPKVFPDNRGFFLETYSQDEFAKNGVMEPFVQDNHSRSTQGVLRALHYQAEPAAQSKLVRVLFGEIFDVAVDIRKGSPTYGKWAGFPLSADNRHMLYIPTGFAHGFATVSEAAEIEYKVSHTYSPEHEKGIRWDDPEIGIRWPVEQPVLSARDASSPLLRDADNTFAFSPEPEAGGEPLHAGETP